MSDIVDILDSTTNNDSININVDDDSDESGETPFQRLVRLHASPSNYNERKNAVKYILDALRLVNDLESLYEILSCTKKHGNERTIEDKKTIFNATAII
ncbi:unnamed protein product [Rotaria sp. Silwood1]|nr:unnamed protein product [Rotaria sp. Silwood1]